MGIGDIIYSKGILDNVKNDYDKIYVSPSWSIVREYSPERFEEYSKFVNFLFQTFFSESPYEIVEDPTFPAVSPVILGGLPVVKPDIRKYFKGEPPDRKPYITLTTKVRGTSLDLYKEVLPDFITTLYFLSKKYDILLLGERSIGMHKEYQQHGPSQVFSLYDSIPKTVPNLIDMTEYNELGFTAPSIPIFKRDCNLMAHAVCAVSVGGGGNFCIASALANTISLCRYLLGLDIVMDTDGNYITYPFLDQYNNHKDSTVQVYQYGPEFIHALNQL
jgi:hypothetical protein